MQGREFAEERAYSPAERGPVQERPRVEIEYCTRCRWLLRAGWVAQELLATFESELGGVTLIPNAEGGVFEVRLAGESLFSRAAAGRFPEAAELKRLVRDRVAPGRDLGHVEGKRGAS
jgi:selenoprotein W-related protein